MAETYPCNRCGKQTELRPGRVIQIQTGSIYSRNIMPVDFDQPLCDECVEGFRTWWKRETNAEYASEIASLKARLKQADECICRDAEANMEAISEQLGALKDIVRIIRKHSPGILRIIQEE